MKQFVAHTLLPGELGKWDFHPTKNNDARNSPVVRLLGFRRPTAVPRLVVTVNVDPIERFAGWPRTHISQKRVKIVLPFLTHSDPAPSILRVFGIVWVIASRLCVVASAQFWCAFSPKRMAVLLRSGNGDLVSQAAAACCQSGPDTFECDRSRGAAKAGKFPHRAAPIVRRPLQSRQPAVFLSGNI